MILSKIWVQNLDSFGAILMKHIKYWDNLSITFGDSTSTITISACINFDSLQWIMWVLDQYIENLSSKYRLIWCNYDQKYQMLRHFTMNNMSPRSMFCIFALINIKHYNLITEFMFA